MKTSTHFSVQNPSYYLKFIQIKIRRTEYIKSESVKILKKLQENSSDFPLQGGRYDEYDINIKRGT